MSMFSKINQLIRAATILLVLLVIPTVVSADELAPFTTDGCSAFPDGVVEHQSLWLDCCIKHDLAYWAGGSYDERQAADISLKECVVKTGEPEIANIMLAGVRVGGSPYFPTTYRWGYGWPYPRGYQTLTDDESSEVINKLKIFMKMVDSISHELEIKKETNKGSS